VIYSDSDGVICDFYTGAEKLLGHQWIGGTVRDRDGAVLSQQHDFWETLPPMPDLDVYWGFLKKYNPQILTAVPSAPWGFVWEQVERGKREWYRKNIPSIPHSHIHIVERQDKQNFARNGQVRNILIDDHENNIREFEAAGGVGILHHSAKTTIIKLKELGYF